VDLEIVEHYFNYKLFARSADCDVYKYICVPRIYSIGRLWKQTKLVCGRPAWASQARPAADPGSLLCRRRFRPDPWPRFLVGWLVEARVSARVLMRLRKFKF